MAEERLRRAFSEHFDFVWRALRRLGVPDSTVPDASQQVWIVASKKLPEDPAAERGFLFATAMRVAANVRRGFARSREVSDGYAPEAPDPAPRADEALDRHRARLLLDEVLDALPEDLRAIFILFEFDGMSSAEIAALLSIPVGTVASRLRRGREEFQRVAKRVRARHGVGGAT